MVQAALFIALFILSDGYAAQLYDYSREILFKAHGLLAQSGATSPPRRIDYLRDRRQRRPVAADCPDTTKERVIVTLIAGQSNAANHGERRAGKNNDHPAILNFYEGRCYIARHPLLGATGAAASPWIDLAERLLDEGTADKIVLISTAIGATRVDEWAPGGEFHDRLVKRTSEAANAGLRATHFLWHQGESDAQSETSFDQYARDLRRVIESVRNVTGEIPTFIALASRCGATGPVERIRQAQLAVAAELPNSFVAFDSDAIGDEGRHDGCHFAPSGLEMIAAGFFEAIIRARPQLAAEPQ